MVFSCMFTNFGLDAWNCDSFVDEYEFYCLSTII